MTKNIRLEIAIIMTPTKLDQLDDDVSDVSDSSDSSDSSFDEVPEINYTVGLWRSIACGVVMGSVFHVAVVTTMIVSDYLGYHMTNISYFD